MAYEVNQGTLNLNADLSSATSLMVNAGGTLSVNGKVSSTTSATVNAGGTLGGIGIVGNTMINGGTLAPGNSIGTLTVNGSLTLTAASTYMVEVSLTNADKTIVTGTASLAGKVNVGLQERVRSSVTYTILNAGTLSGTFDSAYVTGGFGGVARLSYSGNDVLVTVFPGLSPALPNNAATNHRNVAAGIDRAMEAGANLPKSFDPLFGMTGNQLLNALTQISGETSTGSQQTTFTAMDMFMGMMTDPFTAGRGEGAPGALPYAGEAMAYAAPKRAPTDAFASMHRKAPIASLQERWNVWAAGFGGSQTTDGNADTGSNNSRSSIYGMAVGADYWFSPFTVAGVSMAGGGTNFSVTGGGTGRSDLFQFGGFIRHNVGSTYITAAAAYGWQDITTDRTVTVAGFDQLRANFNANSYSGRVEVGNRFVAPWIGGLGLTPYAAFQVTAFDLPAYTESVVAGSNTFALAYAGKTALSPRSELGLRTDKSFAVNDAILTLRGRAAWAHDTNRDRSASATFLSLPGASFVVNGASLAKHTALTSASAELKWMNGWSVAGTFEGEFSDVTKSYAGKGVVRYAW